MSMMFTARKFLIVAALTCAFVMPAAHAAAQDKAQLKKGQDVYNAQKCQSCHAIAGKGNKQNPLDGVGKKITADEIRQWILSPTEMTAKVKSTKKPPMPAKYKAIPAADLDALVAYLQSL
ncbi:MAG TPA: cytochrome c [Vicinamibacterales bacterium]|nr:cytochrome c [Vicinamibacterales bacterium]